MLVHYSVAVTYRKIAKDVPTLFNDEEVKEPTTLEKTWDRFMQVLNLVAGVLNGTSTYIARSITWV